MDFNLDKNQRTVLFIDLNNIFHANYYVAKANNKNPVHTIFYALYNLRSSLKHDYALAVIDGETAKQSRLDFYPEYKGTRPEKTDEEKAEMDYLKPIMKEICLTLGINHYESSVIEADDVIGILSTKSVQNKWNAIVVSSDKDFRQLCYLNNMNIYHPQEKIAINQFNVFEKTGVKPNQYVDALCLIGDKADNVIGVPKIGQKTAESLLRDYADLNHIKAALIQEGVLDMITDIKTPLSPIKKAVWKQNLIEFFEQEKDVINKKLIGFHYDKANEIKIDNSKLIPAQIDVVKLSDFCINHGLDSFKQKYIDPMFEQSSFSQPRKQYKHG